jgi:uncharacterized membrane protein
MFETRAEAESAIHRLTASGISPGVISVAMKDSAAAANLVEATGTTDLAGEGAAAGAVSGAAVGTLVGLAIAGSTFILPGVGTFLIGGPIVAALTGAGVGAASGGLLGALIGSGIPENEAESYAAGIEQGHIFVSANVTDEQAPLVRKIFDEEGSRRTHTA